MAFASTVQEVVWLNKLFEHLSITKDSKGPLILYCDSQKAIAFMKDPKYHSKAKHIEIKYNFVRDIVVSGEVISQYILIREMIVAPFTKVISIDMFETC